jgi:Na+/H+ antiporter NhaD/arsenite permease-like protein
MMVLLEWFCRRYYRDGLHWTACPIDREPAIIRDRTLLRWTLGLSDLILAGFFTHGFTGMPVAVPALVGAAGVLIVQDVLYVRRHRPTHAERVHGLIHVIENEIEWPTLSFFAFLFIAVGAAVQTGLIDTLARGLAALVGTGSAVLGLSDAGSLIFAALLICWASGLLSALVDNIPFVAVSIPIIARLTTELPGDTRVLWWALALGACLGGNGSPIGASANVTVIGLVEREGIRIGFREFLRFGVSVTILTLLVSSLFLAAYVSLGAPAVVRIGLLGLAGIAILRVGRWLALRRVRPSPAATPS